MTTALPVSNASFSAGWTGPLSMRRRLGTLGHRRRNSSTSTPLDENRPTEWRDIARPEQLPPPGDWRVWLIRAGRGWGKTRTGAEWINEQARTHARLTIAGATAADARDIMVEGESGLLSINPAIRYEPSKRRLTWPNGARGTILTADEPERFRGHQHEVVWADELASWRRPDAWDQLMFGLRLGDNPRALVTTTPRPTKLIRELSESPTTHITRGATRENADNLAPAFLDAIVRKYEGTRLGRQELEGELLEDVEGALWTLTTIDEGRVSEAPDLTRIVVAVDPSGGSEDGNDEQGIVVVGVGVNGEGYVLADRSCRLSPDGWGRRAVQAYLDYEADLIVGETNYGGDMVVFTVQTAAQHMTHGVVPTKKITASRGKRQRAEPVAALYEQGRVHHVGSMPELEDQMVQWTPESGESPDRLDALVWALTELMVDGFHTQGVW